MMSDARPSSGLSAVVQAIVLDAIRAANLSREASAQLTVSADAPIFGPGSPLDSLGLVALLLDIEDALRVRGFAVLLSDERAISQRRSPFRTVATLVDYIGSVLQPA